MADDDDGDRSLSQTVSDTRQQDKSSKNSRVKSAVSAAGRSLSSSGQQMLSDSRDTAASKIGAVSYRKGGKTRKDGPANLHKNERVIPASKRKKVEKMMKRDGMSLTNKKRGKSKRSSGR